MEMLAEPIVVPDGDTFLQEPQDINEPGMPRLPQLTWTQMACLHREIELILVREPDRAVARVQITSWMLPKLPLLERADLAHVERRLEEALHQP
jgi:hypothetical protein